MTQLWTGIQPFHDIHQDTAIVISIVMREARPDYPDPAPVGTHLLWAPLFEKCWKSEPGERLDMEAVVQIVTNTSLPQP